MATSERLAADALVRFERIGLRPWTRDLPWLEEPERFLGIVREWIGEKLALSR